MENLMRTRYYFPEEARTLEENTLPSETQPEDVMTISEMLNRHVQGLPIEGGNGFSDFPEELGYIPDNINSLDLVEIDELRQAVNARFKELEAKTRSGSAANTDEGGKRPASQAEPDPTDPPKPPAEGAPS